MEDKSERSKSSERPSKRKPSKEDAIRNSKMPKSQKREALMAIGVIKKPTEPTGRVSFKVYVEIKKIAQRYHGAMLAYPKASGVELSTLSEWEQIFKGF